MFKEFREFALKGSLIDFAVAFIMGAAFVKLTGSFIDDLIMPIVGKISGGMNFSNLYFVLGKSEKFSEGMTLADAKASGSVVLAYGNFITVGINFMILAFLIFIVVKAVNKLKKAEAAAPAEPPAQEVLLTEIRNLLKK
jgi:large conductance mechanosensitive channel